MSMERTSRVARRFVAAVLLAAGASAFAEVPPALRDMKRDHDAIQRGVPETWERRLAILQAVTARRSNAATWRENRRRAHELWQRWGPIHAELAAGRTPAYDGEALAADGRRMQLCEEKFRPVRNLLIDHDLAAVKKDLAYQWYLVRDPDPGLDPRDVEDLGMSDAFYLEGVDETLVQYQERAKARIRGYLRPGAARWINIAGYNFTNDPFVRGLGNLNGTPIHWTLYRANLGNLATLEVDVNGLDAIYEATVPNRADLVGVHVTLERYGANDPRNPSVFGRPANTGRVRNTGNVPPGVTLDDMAGRLDTENDARVQRVEAFVRRRAAHVRPDWRTH